jgi:methylglutamate dehydrogenase subunit A
MSGRYSAWAIARHAWTGAPWPQVWRHAEPKASYDVVIIGGGGHGLATAYYLAANHGITRVAVIERAYIGSGNVGRNTSLVRSNYMMDGNTQFF